MSKRLTQPFRAWQLAVCFALVSLPFGSTAEAGWYDHGAPAQTLNHLTFPRGVVFVGPPPSSLTEADVVAAIVEGIATWNGVVCSEAELRWDGVVGSLDDVPAGTSPILFVDAEDESCFAISEDIGWTLQGPCDGSRGAYPPQTVLLNDEFEWRADPDPYQSPDGGMPRVDALSVVTHELGHVLDLRHVTTDPLATMAPRYLLDGGLASLSAADKFALCEKYPTGTSECATDGDCATFTSCVSGGDVSVCDEERQEPGEYCDRAHLTCREGCFVTSPPTHSGYCTAACGGDEDCPDDMFCEEAEGECRLSPIFDERSGCSTSGATGVGWTAGLFGVLLAGLSRRRRR